MLLKSLDITIIASCLAVDSVWDILSVSLVWDAFLVYCVCEGHTLSFTIVCWTYSCFFLSVWGTQFYACIWNIFSVVFCFWTLSFYSCVWHTLSVFRVSVFFSACVWVTFSIICLRVGQTLGFNIVCGTHTPFYACVWDPHSLFRFVLDTLCFILVGGHTLCFTAMCEIRSPFYAFVWDTLFVCRGCVGPSLGLSLVYLDTPSVLRLCVGHTFSFKRVWDTLFDTSFPVKYNLNFQKHPHFAKLCLSEMCSVIVFSRHCATHCVLWALSLCLGRND